MATPLPTATVHQYRVTDDDGHPIGFFVSYRDAERIFDTCADAVAIDEFDEEERRWFRVLTAPEDLR